MLTIFSIFALIYSIIIHEYAHGWMADRLGDPTARHSGRLTLNPVPHIDPIGSILIPGFLVMTGSSFLIGWAKPVPFNPYNLTDKKYGSLKVAAAGPASNFLIALSLGLILRFLPADIFVSHSAVVFAQLISSVIWLNLLLMVFNLLPIPPLDGSKIFLSFLPQKFQEIVYRFEQFGMLFLFALLFLLFPLVILPVVSFLFKIIVGF
jgi:Zn-dependent protease